MSTFVGYLDSVCYSRYVMLFGYASIEDIAATQQSHHWTHGPAGETNTKFRVTGSAITRNI